MPRAASVDGPRRHLTSLSLYYTAILLYYVRASVTAKQHMQWIEVAKEARGGQGFQELLLNPVTQSLSERKSERVIPAQGEGDHGMRLGGPKKAGRGHDGSDDRGLRRRS